VFAAQVFKSVTDPFVGKVSFFRVFSGGAGGGETVVNLRTKNKSKLSQLFRVQGKEQEPVDRAVAGDIVCVAKVEDFQLADTIGSSDGEFSFAPFACPEPMVSLAVEPKKRGDEGKIGGSLDKLAQEDPTFKVTRDSRTHEMVIAGMSNLHLDIMLERLKRRFDVEVDTKEPKIPYKETVTKGAQGHYKHKKQTGGRGQYGEVYLRVAPLQRGEGFKFSSEVVGGNIPTQYIPAVEKGVREALVKGIIAGYPIEDVEVIVTDGSYHSVDSSEAAFKIAASRAFREAFMEAKPCLLEPIVDIQVTAPISHMGDITGDLNSRRGRILGIDSHGSVQTINAQVPLGEIMRYSTELRSTTGGEGSYSLQFSRYDIVPAQIAEGLVKSKTQQEEEE
jgi:elongation factor G